MSDQVVPHSNGAVADEPIPELLRLGEQLAQARQAAGLTLEGLAQKLHVEPRLLQALEEGEHQQLPEGVFIVALARRVAQSLHINVDNAIAKVRQSRLMEYRPPGRTTVRWEPQPSHPSQPVPVTPTASRRPRVTAGPPRSVPWRWPLAALIAACGAAAAWLLLPQPPRVPSTSQSQSPSTPAPTAKSPPITQSAAGKKAMDSEPTAKPGAPTSPAPTPPSTDTLRLQAKEPSWIEVRDADGRTVFEGTLSGEKDFPLGRGLEVIAGRPYAVTAAIGANPSTTLGGVDDIRWKRFGPGTLTPAAPPPPATTP